MNTPKTHATTQHAAAGRRAVHAERYHCRAVHAGRRGARRTLPSPATCPPVWAFGLVGGTRRAAVARVDSAVERAIDSEKRSR
jgi:hypothetical protein